MSDYAPLRSLLALKHHKSLTAAAHSMNCPKSTLSRRLAVLEEQLGYRLTEQKEGHLRLTCAGECYAEHAKNILQLVEEAQQALDCLKTQLQGQIRIGLCTELARGWSTEVLNEFLAAHPAIQLDIRTFNPVESSFQHHPLPVCDLYISCMPIQIPAYKEHYLGQWKRAFYQSSTQPPYPEMIRLEQFEALPWITLSGYPETLEVHQHSGQGKEIQMKSRCQTASLTMQADAIIKGFGVGLLPCWLAECRQHGLRGLLREIKSDWQAKPTLLGIYSPVHPAPRIQKLIDFLYQKRPKRWV